MKDSEIPYHSSTSVFKPLGSSAEVVPPIGKLRALSEIRRAVRDFRSEQSAGRRVLEYSGEFGVESQEMWMRSTIPRIGTWSRGECIGSGSGGSTFVCLMEEKENLGKCAVKQISFDGLVFDDIPSQMRAEVEALGICNHPKIVSFIGAEVSGNYLCIFMDLVEGESLANKIKREGRLKERECIKIAADILDALSFVHSRGVIHRDLKAGNVIIQKNGESILCDFGACAISEPIMSSLHPIGDTAVIPEKIPCEFTKTDFYFNGVKGTPNWCAPEVLSGTSYGFNADVWSLGCLVVEIATGQIPWREFDNQLAAMYAILQSDKTPMDFIEKKLLSSWSSLLRNYLKCCLIRDPVARWSANRLLKHPWIYLPITN